MNFFENELRRMVGTVYPNAKYIGRAAYVDLGGGNQAKFLITTQGVADEYTALKAKIVNKTQGTIDTMFIRFEDVFSPRNGSNTHAWTYNGKTEWYNFIPDNWDYAAMNKVVKEYTGLFMIQDPAPRQEQTMC